MKSLKNSKSFRITLLLILSLSIWTSCSKSEDPEPVNEEELITTVNVTFTNNADPDDVVVASFEDLDGPGGEDGTTTHPTLSANATYTVSVEFLNESVTPTEDITEEVAEEADEHQIFFVSQSGLNFSYTYDDEDANSNPIGIEGTVITGDASTGTLAVILIHQPNKTATGVSDGNITNAGGEEDVRVTFNVTIQ